MSATATASVLVGAIGAAIGIWLMAQGAIGLGLTVAMALIGAGLGAVLGAL